MWWQSVESKVIDNCLDKNQGRGIQKAQQDEQKLQQLFQPVGGKRLGEFTKDDEWLWRYKGGICIPNVGNLSQDLLSKAHNSGFSIHPGSTKMYYDLKKMFWWPGMKGDVATVISKCLTYQKSFRNEAMSHYHISSANGWTVGKDYSDIGRYAEAETTKKIKKIREKILTAQSRQKSYADQRRKPLEFEIGELVFLRVTPTTRIGRAIKTKKLNPRYIGPFEILRRFEPEAY
nr:uncharacterized protein LOC112778800 [Arachis hypogaea]